MIQTNKPSQVQNQIAKFPELFEEFRALERLFCEAGSGCYIDPNYHDIAMSRLNELDSLFGFSGASQFRKTGIEVSHWESHKGK